MTQPFNALRSSLFLALGLAVGAAQLAAQAPTSTVAHAHLASDVVWWQSTVDNDGLVLTVTGPNELAFQQTFPLGQSPLFRLNDDHGVPRADGVYSYELHVLPVLEPGVRDALKAARATGDESLVASLRAAKLLPGAPLVHSGHFRVLDGEIFRPTEELEEPPAPQQPTTGAGPTGRLVVQPVGNGKPEWDGDGPPPPDQVILDDLIVNGSICAGMDCANGEAFGFDTIRLKENNLRIRFVDTSNTSSFPGRDWQLTANDSSNGGLDKFSIDDIDGGRTPFTIEANAPSHSLYVDDGGRVGFGTSTPVVELHVRDGDTPTLRLEQDGSSGFGSQTWDVAGNEAGFFIRDASNGSTLPFRIIPGAPTDSLRIESDGKVTLKESLEFKQLQVQNDDGTTQLIVEESSPTAAARTLMELRNNGGVGMALTDTRLDSTWMLDTNNSQDFRITSDAGEQMRLDNFGNLSVTGAMSDLSDLNSKRDVASVDPQGVLAKLAQLPVWTWAYKQDALDTRHMGPMAQDFFASFGLGTDDRHIAPLDATGVALVAIQELHREAEAKDARMAELEEQLAALAARLDSMER